MNQPSDELEPPLSRRIMNDLEAGPTPPVALEERVLRGLRAQRILAPRRSVRPWVAALLAAGIAFTIGLWVGQARPRPNVAETSIDVAGRELIVRAAPGAPEVAMIRDALNSAVVAAPLINRAAPSTRPVTWF